MKKIVKFYIKICEKHFKVLCIFKILCYSIFVKKIEINEKLNLKYQYRKNKKFRTAVEIFCVIIGSFIAGLAFPTFFLPAEIIPSGLSGIALLIAEGLGSADFTSIIYLILNLILFLFALKLFGWKFIMLTLIGLGAYTFALEFFAIPGLSNPVDQPQHFQLLYSIIGGGLGGVGQGIAFRVGGSTGGSDIAAKIINKYFPKVKTGVAVLIINFIVITTTVLVKGWQTALYAIIVAVISTITCDMVLDGAKTVKAFYIICDKDKEISEKILKEFHRGVTVIPAQGVFSGKEKKMLLCLVASYQAREMKEIVKETDKNAFVFSTAVSEPLGDGYFMREVSIHKSKVNSAQVNIKTKIRYKVLKNRPKKYFGKKFKNK